MAVVTMETIETIFQNGPTRVVTRVEDGCVGYADTVERAAQKGFAARVVYVRNDGWSLGAEFADEAACARLWRGDWLYRLNMVSGLVEKIGK